MAAEKKENKLIRTTASSYSSANICKLGAPFHDVTVDLLVNLVSAIGHRQAAISASRKKSRSRTRKRKRAASSSRADGQRPADSTVPNSAQPTSSHSGRPDVLVGFNEVTRHLEKLSSESARQFNALKEQAGDQPEELPDHVAVVFLLRPMDGVIYSHLPALCVTASFHAHKLSSTRLVVLDPSTETRIADALQGSPRVSVLAILEKEARSPTAEALLEYVRENVEPPQVPWLREAVEGEWLGTKIDSREVHVAKSK